MIRLRCCIVLLAQPGGQGRPAPPGGILEHRDDDDPALVVGQRLAGPEARWRGGLDQWLADALGFALSATQGVGKQGGQA